MFSLIPLLITANTPFGDKRFYFSSELILVHSAPLAVLRGCPEEKNRPTSRKGTAEGSVIQTYGGNGECGVCLTLLGI